MNKTQHCTALQRGTTRSQYSRPRGNIRAACVSTLQGHSGWVWSVAFHPSAPYLATGTVYDCIGDDDLSHSCSSRSCRAKLRGGCGGYGRFRTVESRNNDGCSGN